MVGVKKEKYFEGDYKKKFKLKKLYRNPWEKV